MSLVKVNDTLDIKITNDKELEKAKDLFSKYLAATSNHNIDAIEKEINLENEMKLLDLENAMKLYRGDYFIVE